ncbi:UNVERIFIED_CONTAM: hypothetical protein K2H54_041422 [Gekko kuhli]
MGYREISEPNLNVVALCGRIQACQGLAPPVGSLTNGTQDKVNRKEGNPQDNEEDREDDKTRRTGVLRQSPPANQREAFPPSKEVRMEDLRVDNNTESLADTWNGPLGERVGSPRYPWPYCYRLELRLEGMKRRELGAAEEDVVSWEVLKDDSCEATLGPKPPN